MHPRESTDTRSASASAQGVKCPATRTCHQYADGQRANGSQPYFCGAARGGFKPASPPVRFPSRLLRNGRTLEAVFTQMKRVFATNRGGPNLNQLIVLIAALFM
jgi:hypothetical protein